MLIGPCMQCGEQMFRDTYKCDKEGCRIDHIKYKCKKCQKGTLFDRLKNWFINIV